MKVQLRTHHIKNSEVSWEHMLRLFIFLHSIIDNCKSQFLEMTKFTKIIQNHIEGLKFQGETMVQLFTFPN